MPAGRAAKRSAGAARRQASSKLALYARKRDFAITPEPRGRVGSAGGRAYLIQKHAARRLHYDFRLELDGVLKSWAVTKGPSLDPADRRLAVHVEDHPLDYGTFEGVIPQGQYGGGTVMLWDRGAWEPVDDPRKAYAQGKLKFVLKGKRLKGAWMLVRMGGRAAAEKRDNWLLIKEHDRYARPDAGDALTGRAQTSVVSGKTMEKIATAKNAKIWQSAARDPPKSTRPPRPMPKNLDPARIPGARPAPLPDFVPPQLASLAAGPPKSADWVHEIKIDGYRAYCRRRGDTVRFLTRSGQDWTARFAALVAPIASLPSREFALDGEIAVFDERGISSFAALQTTLSTGKTNRLIYVVFDLLHLDGYDLRDVPLARRKALLKELLTGAPAGGPLRYSEHLRSPGGEVFTHACELALEGLVSKKADGPYVQGRSGDWVKSKCLARDEFVIGGYTPPKKSGRAGFSSLILGYFEEEKLHYAGHVGTGFNQKLLADIAARLTKLTVPTTPFTEPLPPVAKRRAIWVKPELVCEIAFSSWTTDGVLRQPSFQGLREDKPAQEVHAERPRLSRQREAAETRTRSRHATTIAGKSAEKRAASPTVSGVPISHPGREIFPDLGVTKGDLAQYYAVIAEWILPEIADRPLSLLRCPEGTSGQCFFQKHFPTGMSELDRVPIHEKRGTKEYLVVRDAHGLVALIQEGVIEIHPWGARAENPNQPDRIVFDLDPGTDIEFGAVAETAQAMRDFLSRLDLDSFAKTTGGKGMHVVVPLKRGSTWQEVKAFAHTVAETFARADPSRFIATPSKSARRGKIYIDYLRNDQGSTAVAGYCVRAQPRAGVAMPLAWREVRDGLDPRKYDIKTVPKILRSRRDPWRDLYRSRQRLTGAALKALGIA